MSEKQTKNSTKLNYIKTRDDSDIVIFEKSDGHKFKLSDDKACSWLNGKDFTEKELRPRIEPWLTSLFQSEHLTLLVGAGLTHAVHRLATGKQAAGMGEVKFNNLNDEINAASKISAMRSGREEGNFEDQIRVANELLRGLEILKNTNAGQLRDGMTSILTSFSQSILTSEKGIAEAQEEEREKAFKESLN